MRELVLYRWRLMVLSTRWLATEADIRAQLGDRVIERIEDSREVRRPDPEKDSAGRLGRR